nr:hypothetical protein [Tanacetum cinerariifolium]
MNDDIFMTSSTLVIKPVYTIHLSLKATRVLLAFLTILVISVGYLKHAILVENLSVNCCLSSTHPSMLPSERFSNHPLAHPSRVCWNIRHHTGLGHSPEFVVDENWLRWSSGSVVPSYNLMFAGILNSGPANYIILRVNGVLTASLKGLFRSTSPIAFPVTTIRTLVRSSPSSKLRCIGDTLPRPLCSFNSDLRADRCPSICSLTEGVASTKGFLTLTSGAPPEVDPRTFSEMPLGLALMLSLGVPLMSEYCSSTVPVLWSMKPELYLVFLSGVRCTLGAQSCEIGNW